jgi:hypothetical protein
MTGKDREDERRAVRVGDIASGCDLVAAVGFVVCRTSSKVRRHLTKSGHAFYVINPDDLFVRGVPFRHNYTQFSAGLP